MLLPAYRDDDLAGVLRGLEAHFSADVPPEAFRPIGPAAGRICAVDGGSSVLFDGGSFTVATARAGYVVYDGHDLVNEVVSPVGFRLFGSSEIDGDGGFQAPISSWRDGMESDASLDALQMLEPGDTLVLDGSLMKAGSGVRMDELMAAARDRGVHVAGLSKKTRLVHGGRPAVMSAVLSAAAGDVSPPWHLPLMIRGGVTTSVAMLHGISTFAFRVDHTDGAALDALAAASGDPVYPGYPYPLARVHNSVAIHGPISRGLRAVLADRCLVLEGIEEYHEVLDRNW